MTPYEKYVKRLEELKAGSEGIIYEASADVQAAIYDALLVWIDDTLEMKGGNLVASLETLSLLNDFSEGFRRTVAKLAPYENMVVDFVKSLPAMADEMTGFQKGRGINVGKAGLAETEQIVVDGIVDAYTDSGLNANLVQPLRDLLYQNIAAGTRMQDAKATLRDYIKSGKDHSGKVERYLTQTAQQAVDGYTGAINKKLMDAFDYGHLIVSGSLIKTSSPQCRFCISELKGVLSRKEWEKQVKPLAEANGLIAGTTFQSLPLNKLHWNCRHEFTPIIMEEGDQLSAGEIFTNGKVENIN